MKKPIYKRWWFIVLIAIMFISAIGSAGEEEVNGKDNVAAIEQTEANNETEEEPKKEEIEESSSKNVQNDIPKEYISALKKAGTYANSMHMSKVGLYNQLTSEYGEKFSTEAAQYAIENVKANWNENALKKAITYQDKMAMSPSAIYDQLVSEHGEQFTAEEANYAIDNLPK